MKSLYILIKRSDMSEIILYLFWVRLLHPSSPLNFEKKMFSLKILKQGIFLRAVSKRNALFYKMYPEKMHPSSQYITNLQKSKYIFVNQSFIYYYCIEEAHGKDL